MKRASRRLAACLLLHPSLMDHHHGLPTIGRKLDPDEDWREDQPTLIDEPYVLRARKAAPANDEPYLLSVRKLDAPPADEREELESARDQLHATVDQLIDRALDTVGELRAVVEQTQRRQAQLDEELTWVVCHANAVVRAESSRPRRRDDTIVEFPTAHPERRVRYTQ